MTLEEFVLIAHSRFNLDGPMYVRLGFGGGLVEVTGATLEIDVLASKPEARRCVLTTEPAIKPVPLDPSAMFAELVDRVAPKKKDWEGGE